MDQADDDTTQIPYAYNRRGEYGPAGFDRKHTFTVNYVYTLPTLNGHNAFLKHTAGGWEITGITRYWSGFPFSVLSPNSNPGTLDAGNYGGGIRADSVGGPLYPATQTWQQFFNTAAFARPLDGTQGNLGRNALRGPGISQWDISIFKNINVTENVRFQLRLETFNTFNHTQFAQINNSIRLSTPGQVATAAVAGTAGQVTATRDPRTVQIGAKFYF